jgi:hypothetical protein
MDCDTQKALNHLVLAACIVAVRFSPAMRQTIIGTLAADHEQELVDAVARRALRAGDVV